MAEVGLRGDEEGDGDVFLVGGVGDERRGFVVGGEFCAERFGACAWVGGGLA